MDIRLIVLGSGQDGGTPQFGSPVTVAAPRTASSVAVVTDAAVYLLDASPDIRYQWSSLRSHDVHQRLPDGVFVTHAHMGHYAGLLHFGREAADAHGVPLIAPSTVIEFLTANEPWRTLLRSGNLAPGATEDGPFADGVVEIDGIPVPHRGEFGATVAFSVRSSGDPLALYVPDIDRWDDWPDAESIIAEHPICLLDATFSDPGELPGRNLADIPHPMVPDTLARFGHLARDRRLILTHINHSNPVGRPDSDMARRAESAFFEIASDGMVVAP